MKLAAFALLILTAVASASAKKPHSGSGCLVASGIIVCHGHIATHAEEMALLPPEYRPGYASGVVARNSSGKIKRSMTARQEFLSQTPCPATGQTGRKCHGYVIDHVIPLACGGADAPYNMQFQSVADAKAKDKVERRGCQH